MATLLSNISQAGAGPAYRPIGPNRTFQAIVSGSGAVSATVVVEATNDTDILGNPGNWLPPIGTITLSGTGTATDGFPSNAAWLFVRMRVTAISGTNAAVRGTVEVF